MPNSKDFVDIDGKKLKQTINEKGFSIKLASKKIGRDYSYLYRILKRNQIKKEMINVISACLGIEFSEYEPEEPKKPIQYEVIRPNENTQNLMNAITFAYIALEPKIEEMLTRAFKKALEV